MEQYNSKDFQSTSLEEILINAAKMYVESYQNKNELNGCDWWGGFQLDGIDYDVNIYSTSEFGTEEMEALGEYSVDIYRYEDLGNDRTSQTFITRYIVNELPGTLESVITDDECFINVIVRLNVSDMLRDGVTTDDIISDCDYSFTYEGKDIDSEITDMYEI